MRPAELSPTSSLRRSGSKAVASLSMSLPHSSGLQSTPYTQSLSEGGTAFPVNAYSVDGTELSDERACVVCLAAPVGESKQKKKRMFRC
jgi:hypothetical protein